MEVCGKCVRLCLPAISMILRSARTAYTTHPVHVTTRMISDPRLYTFILLTVAAGLRVYDPLSTVSFLSDTSENPLCPLSSFLLIGGYKCSLP